MAERRKRQRRQTPRRSAARLSPSNVAAEQTPQRSQRELVDPRDPVIARRNKRLGLIIAAVMIVLTIALFASAFLPR
jgi:hypothetical protein